jgi:hypothetical protein
MINIAIVTASEDAVPAHPTTTDIGTMDSTEVHRKATAGIVGKTERTIKTEDDTPGGSE